MATTRIIPMHCDKSKSIAKAIATRTDYAKNPDKTRGMELISAYECDPITVDAEFLFSKRIYSDITGRDINKNRDVLAYQIRQSFKPGEVTPEQANQIGYQLAMEFTKGRHQFIVATHEDKEHIHSHIIFNSTMLDCGHKFNNYKNSALNVRKISDRLCLEHGLSVVENPSKGKHYAEWNAERSGTSWKARLRKEIDKYIDISTDFEDMLKRMEADGFTIKRAKYHSYKLPGADEKTRFTGGPSLGPEYTDKRIRERIAGLLKTPVHGTRRQPQGGGINLLIDIENNIKAQQSAGYARALEIINLKEAARTLNYLTENNILQYSQLQAKISEVTAANQQTADTLKQVEKRIADMGALIKNIELYERTKPVYTQYRQSKNKERYRQEHESEIILHESARKKLLAVQADRDSGKLPNPNTLRAECDNLTKEKEKLYQEYGKLKNHVKQLDSVRANVDKILNASVQESHRERKQGIDL